MQKKDLNDNLQPLVIGVVFFCLEVGGKLHSCSTMQLDHSLRKMATEIQDSVLLARIAGGDLIAIEAKYHFNCL